MKRSLNSELSLGGDLKRRNSSLFSIATMMEDSDLRRRPSEILDSKRLMDSYISREVSLSSNVATEEGTNASDHDFFIEDDADTASALLNHPFETIVVAAPESLVSLVRHAAVETGDMKTGLFFESSPNHADRHNRLHKERPLRVTSVQDALRKAGFEERCAWIGEEKSLDQDTNDGTMCSPERKFLQDEDFLRVHLPGYMQRLDKLSGCSCHDTLDREAQQYKSIFFTKDSVSEAKNATASLCRLVSKVVHDDLDNGFAVIRPPGHHAEPGVAGGYCVINNVAVAAAYARERLGVEKVLIVDWDVHHGNGTQRIFLKDPNVMYFSVHRWQGGNFFPFLMNGGPTTVGIDDGVGYNVNVGWNRKGMGDDEYEAVWEKVLMPMARDYKPDLVLVSAGFDAADGDMGECRVSPECFGDLTRSLKTLANGKVVCTLEGGYVRSVLGKCVSAVVEALLERKTDDEQDNAEDNEDLLNEIDASAAKSIRTTISAHRLYWKCFKDD